MLGEILGNYRVVEQLGQGGMGVVYVGRHETLGHRVVVKVLRSEMSRNGEMVRRFFNEAQAATAIRNPGIVQVFDFGTTRDGRAYFVMELLEGQSLGDRIATRKLEIVECCRIARQIANVLQSAHDAGITHRDLKPDNLFLVPDPEVIGGERVKVLDFGIAKLAGELQAARVETRVDVVMGTPSYMSPEQCRGARAVDSRSDIYALGCILFKMVAGRAPFVGPGTGDIIGAHLHVPPPDLQSLAPEAPPELAMLVAKMLAKQPEGRPQTMAAVSQALDELLRALASPGRAATVPPGAAAVTLPGPGAPAAASSLVTTMPAAAPATPPGGHAIPQPGGHVAPPSGGHAALQPGGATPPSGSPAAFQSGAHQVRPSGGPAAFQSGAHQARPSGGPAAFQSGGHPAPSAGGPIAPSLPVHTPTPLPGALPSATSTTLGASAGWSSVQVRPSSRRLPFVVLGGLVVAGAIAAIALVLTGGESSPQGREVSYGDIAAAPPVPNAAELAAPAVATAAAATPPAPTPMPGSAAGGTGEAEIVMEGDDLQAECTQLQAARKWAELERCADRLQSVAPQRAAELKARAVEEQTAPRIAGFEKALRDKDLRVARTYLDQISPDLAEHAKLKGRYLTAENQAIADLAEELGRLKDLDCEEHAALVADERARKPTRVITEATRKVPCTKCDADELARKAADELARRQYAAALRSYDASLACRPDPALLRKALEVACRNNALAQAKSFWKRLPAGSRAGAKSVCISNGITEAELDAP